MQDQISDPRSSVVESQANALIDDNDQTQRLKTVEIPLIVETPRPLIQRSETDISRTIRKKPQPAKYSKREAANAFMLQERCRQLCLSLFSRGQDPVRSLGFTSSVGGEGKSLLALVTAKVLAHDSNDPVTLVECNWAHPTLHEYLGITAKPGLAEWLRGTCNEDDIRYQIDENLTVIPAGDGMEDAVKLLKRIQHRGLHNLFGHPDDLLIVDLPAVITSSYGSLAASLVETVVVIVRSETIPESLLAETCSQLKDTQVHGIILNQGNSRIPRWIRQLL